MLRKTADFLRGSVTLRIRAEYPERVLNVLSAQNIPFRDFVQRDSGSISLTVHRRDRDRVRAALERLSAPAEIERRTGVPFFLGRFRRRRMLIGGLAFFALALLAGSLFVADLTVTGNETVPDEKILRAVAKNGLHRGSFSPAVNAQELCNRTLPDLPELAWLSVTMRGCRACIEVRERVPKPEIVNEAAPTNVVSRRAALVTEVRALDGEARVMKGSTVFPGQLLISGAVDTTGTARPSVSSRFLAGRGEVFGRTWYEFSVPVPLRTEERGRVIAKKRAITLRFSQKKFRIGAKERCYIGADCDKITERKDFTLPGGILLPFALERETCVFYETVSLPRERDEAFAQGKDTLRRYLLSCIDGRIAEEHWSCAAQDGGLLVTLRAECLEQIGQSVPIELQ